MGPTGNTRVVQIHPTRRCNLRCLHCYSSSSPEERGVLDAALLFPAVADLAEEGYDGVSLSGGEPLLYPELGSLLGHAKRQGLSTAVVSNGMLLTPKRLDAIQLHTDLLVISIDGKPASHNAMRDSAKAFDVMVSRLESLRRRGMTFGFIFTLTQHNLDELPWVAEFAVNAGARLLQIHPLEGFGHALRTLAGKVPDELEGAYAWALAERIRAATRGRLAIQVDLVHSEAVLANPAAFFAAETAAVGTRLSELLSPLVIEPDGAVVPLQYGFAREYALGNLHSQTVPRMARRWRQFTWPAFQELCRGLSDELSAGPSRFLNWYEAIAQHAVSRRVPVASILPRRVSKATRAAASRG